MCQHPPAPLASVDAQPPAVPAGLAVPAAPGAPALDPPSPGTAPAAALQHQGCGASRQALPCLAALMEENAVLGRALANAQHRSLSQASGLSARVAQLEADLVRQRGQALARDTELAQQRALLAALEDAAPGLRERHSLAQDNSALREQLQDLHRAMGGLREQLRREQDKTARLQARLSRQPNAMPQAPLAGAPAACQAGVLLPAAAGAAAPPLLGPPCRPRGLADQAVLCVGGRQASVPLYRLVIERTGGRFLHHGGGAQDSPHKLDATLAAADLVICQTGCLSHDAYWRVKDHCKRTGKRCMFVETPSRAALERALAEVVATGQAELDATASAAASP